MAYYYNGRGRNKTLVLKKIVGDTVEVLNGSTGTYNNIPDSILAEFTAPDGTVYSAILTDAAFAQLSPESYYKRLADFTAHIKALIAAEDITAFANMDLTVGATIMVPDATGPVS